MANAWITFVKDYSKKHKIKYSEALKDPKLKSAYQKSKGKGKGKKPAPKDMMDDKSK